MNRLNCLPPRCHCCIAAALLLITTSARADCVDGPVPSDAAAGQESSYSTNRVERPLTLPPGMTAATILAGGTVTRLQELPRPMNDLTQRAWIGHGFSCRVELGIRTTHRVVPLVPFAGAQLEARYSLLSRRLALFMAAALPIPDIPGGSFSAGVSVGLPSRLRIGRSVALMFLDEVIIWRRFDEFVRRQSAFPASYFRIETPVVALLQLSERSAVTLRLNPVVFAQDDGPSRHATAFLPRATLGSTLDVSPVPEVDLAVGLLWTRFFEATGNGFGAHIGITYRLP